MTQPPLTTYLTGRDRPLALVVDDEPGIRRILVRVLTAQGFECLEAEDGASALECLARGPLPLIVTDVKMPGMSGADLLHAVMARWPEAGVLLMTGHGDVATAVTCLNAGALDYVTKPFTTDDIVVRIRQALEKRGMKLALARRKEELELRVAELTLGQFQTWADMLEERDPYLHGHSLRVAAYAIGIAQRLGVGEEVEQPIALGSRLHDVGKIGVHEACLNKPGRVTPEEYAEIMRHPVIGARLMAPYLPRYPTVLAIIRSHHERLDGTGVPDALKGEAIPLPVRIVSVADAFDAMTSARSYRPRQVLDHALRELELAKGTQLDAAAVDAFTSAFPAETLPLLTPPYQPVPLPEEEHNGRPSS